MNDTPLEIRDKQHEIWLSFPLEKRMRIFEEMNQAIIRQVKQRIRTAHPEYSEAKVFAEYINTVFPNQYTQEQLNDIEKWYGKGEANK